jgi:lipopolysaccharide export system protein LptA
MPYLKFIALICLLGSSLQVSAEDRSQVLIHADSMQLDINTGNSVYRGNVSFVQGSTRLSGDTVTVNSKNGSINTVKIEGSPARYSDTSPAGRVLAESSRMEYSVLNNQLSMEGAARLEQDDRVVQSQHIIYDTEKQLILAGQPAGETSDPDQRVNIILTPKKDRTP